MAEEDANTTETELRLSAVLGFGGACAFYHERT